MTPARGLILALILLAGFLTFALLLGVCVQEDAFISLRYARNLVDGHGLVYNPGERVEGYTNFLWTTLLAGGLALGLPEVPLMRFSGLIAALLLLLSGWRLARRREAAAARAATGGLVALSLLACSPPIAVEGVQGLETAFFALLVLWGVWHGAAGRDPDHPRPARALLLSALLLAVAGMTRPEGAGVFGLTFLGGMIHARRCGRPLLSRREVGAAALFVLVFGAFWALRWDWYGSPLPNTFYAKTGGGWYHVQRGVLYLGRFFLYNPVLTLLTGAGVVWACRRRRDAAKKTPDAFTTVAAVVIVGYLLYVGKVGGDFKHTFRFVIPVLAIWALLLDGLVSRALTARPAVLSARLVRHGLAAVLVLVALNALVMVKDNVSWARRRGWDLERRTACGRWLAQNARPGETLAIHSAGIIPYYSGLPTIDMWGLNDRHIGRLRMEDMGRNKRATGHEKKDDAYVLKRRPTYLVEEWFFVVSDPIPDLRQRLFQPGGELTPLVEDYRARSVPLWLDDGRGERRYYFNFLQLED